MSAAATEIALPWMVVRPLAEDLDLGPGLDPGLVQAALHRLVASGGLQAVVVFGSRARGAAKPDSDLDLALISQLPRLTPEQKREYWQRWRGAIGLLGCGVDLVVQGQADAAYLAQSRWHVMGDVAREGRVLYVAG
jgi:predicted nucleotidyltransferase